MYYVVTYTGKFAFIKPWTAVRDGETFSQQFLTPSIIEGIEKKLFPEMLAESGIKHIVRHKLTYQSMDPQQEVTQSRGFNKQGMRERSVIKRNVLLNPVLKLAFLSADDAERAKIQHICLCRNEDILLPQPLAEEMTEEDFNQLPGFELRLGDSPQSFMVGFNRFSNCSPMKGWLEYNGQSL